MLGWAPCTGSWDPDASLGKTHQTVHAVALLSTAEDARETWGRGERKALCPDTPLMVWD